MSGGSAAETVVVVVAAVVDKKIMKINKRVVVVGMTGVSDVDIVAILIVCSGFRCQESRL